jgi:hypothetical protein
VLIVVHFQFSGWAVFLKNSWDTATFVTNYLPFVLFPILYIVARLWRKQGPAKPEEMDFISGIAEIEAATCDEPEPKNAWEKFWRWVVCRILCYPLHNEQAFMHDLFIDVKISRIALMFHDGLFIDVCTFFTDMIDRHVYYSAAAMSHDNLTTILARMSACLHLLTCSVPSISPFRGNTLPIQTKVGIIPRCTSHYVFD